MAAFGPRFGSNAMRTCPSCVILIVLVAFLGLPNAGADEEHGPRPGPGPGPGGRRPGGAWGEVTGLPEDVLARQSKEKVQVPALEDAVRRGFEAARVAADELLKDQVNDGRRLRVPGDHASIQAAIDAAKAGDVIVVGAGT